MGMNGCRAGHDALLLEESCIVLEESGLSKSHNCLVVENPQHHNQPQKSKFCGGHYSGGNDESFRRLEQSFCRRILSLHKLSASSREIKFPVPFNLNKKQNYLRKESYHETIEDRQKLRDTKLINATNGGTQHKDWTT